ncbi:diguanylate cyclase [Azospirillum formosense]|uniref:diguanylate cyclase n=1 Tax=Azospirillum formosense TaxID=861533 RepID=A0ABX2L1N0_9PROT|nr:diguanylate cyclase [Azospirillum formosense]MBY3751649.1 diguanylate cyclase [Azospirillum formosense]NUB19693.1 diguanylate cyclase [Azospirillum formosense]
MKSGSTAETNVLVADDSSVVRKILKDHLEAYGYRVLLARDGREALDLYHLHDIHILITDLEMPRMDGLELCWLIRAEDDQHRTFSILMTADDDTQRRIEAFDAGADEFLTKPIDMPMLRARVRAGERITRTHRVMAEMLNTDYLTGVLNRRRFMERLEQQHRLLQGGNGTDKGMPFAVALFDIDHFKRVNDTYGHSNGDLALTLFAQTCASRLPPGGFLGRMGGEEFCMVLPAPQVETAIAKAEEIRVATEALTARTVEGALFAFTVSVGISPADGTETVADLIKRADESLYFAKNSGRNRTVVCGIDGVAVKARFYVM